LIVTLAGHVDHGKTSIVRALTGVDTDRLAEEKRRGLTIDLGFAYTEFEGARIGFVDVPGHHRFVHNMVAGIAGQQFALLVIAADDGVMPQSREHLQILRLLGLGRGLIALNKIDRVSPEHLTEVRREIRSLVEGSFLAGAEIVELSCETGAGIDRLRTRLAQAAGLVATAQRGGLFRLAIDRAFTVRGTGVVVTGTVVNGSTTLDARLVLGSTGSPLRVRGIHVRDLPATEATAGDRAAINIGGAGLDETRRGDWLLDPATRDPVDGFAARITVLDDFPRATKHNAPVHLYHATSHTEARLLLIEGAPVEPGTGATCDVACERPLHFKIGDRFVIRDRDLGRTLGGGVVIELRIPASRRREDTRRQRLDSATPEDPRTSLIAAARRTPVESATFARDWNLATTTVNELAQDAELHRIGDHLLHPDLVATTAQSIHAVLTEHHGQHPDSPGLSADEICVGTPSTRLSRRLVLAAGVEAGDLRLDNGRYSDAAHRAAIPAEVQRLFESIETWLDSVQPPSLGDIAKRLGRPFATLEREMRALPAFRLAVRVSETRYYLPARLRELAEVTIQLDANGPFTVRDFRDATSVGRNVVIEVLEHFDATGFTRRTADTRRVVGELSQVGTS